MANLRARSLVNFPARVEGVSGVTVTKASGVYTIALGIDQLATAPVVVASGANTLYVPVLDISNGGYSRISFPDLSASMTDSFDPTLSAIAGLSPVADQSIYFTGADAAAVYALTPFARTVLDDADAATVRTTLGVVIGTNVQAFDADLSALAANATNGFWTHTGAGTGAARTITGTANEITITNGDGNAGNPTASLPTALTFTGKTVTGGIFSGSSFTGGTASDLSGFSLRSTGAAQDLVIRTTQAYTGARTVTLNTNDIDATIFVGGNISTAGAFTTSGAFGVTLTTTALTSVTLPTTGTLATLAGAETYTNKILTSPAINGGARTGGTIAAITAFGIRSTGAAFDFKQASAEVLTADHTLSWNLGNADRIITLGGNPTLNGGTHSGTNTGDQTLSMLLSGGTNTTVAQNTTRFMSAFGGVTTSASALPVPVTKAGTLRNFYIVAQQLPGSGQTYTGTIYKNGSATVLTCQITNAAVSASDLTHTVAVVAGDFITIQVISSATATDAAAFTWSCQHDS